MRFYKILYDLDTDSIRFLYKNLQQSKDPKSRNVVINLISGKDIFDSLYPEVDNICKIILRSKQTYGLIVIGEYLKIKHTMQKKLLLSLLYPFILFLISLISIVVISFFIKINFYEIIVTPICLFAIIFIFLRKVLKEFDRINKLNIFIQFLENKISKYYFQMIMKNFNILINFDNITNYQSLIQRYFNVSIDNKKDLYNIYNFKVKNFDKLCDGINKQISSYGIIIISLHTSWIILKFLNGMFNIFI